MVTTGRRTFLKQAGLSAAAAALPSAGRGADPQRAVVAVIGTGGMGTNHLKRLAARVEIDLRDFVVVLSTTDRKPQHEPPTGKGVDYNRQIRFRFFQKIAEHSIERRDILKRQHRDAIHAGAFSFSGAGGSTGIATGGGGVCGALPCLLNLWSKICETAFRAAKTFCPLLEITSKL